MRKIDRSRRFDKDYKRVSAGYLRKVLDEELNRIIVLLASDVPLPPKFSDHPLSGEWKGYRDCHVRPDLLLIYRKQDDNSLVLARLGSHSELF